MTIWANLLTIAQFILLVGGIIGGYIVLRSALAKSKDEIQERVTDALQAENKLLQSRVDRLDKENKRLWKLVALIEETLKKLYGIELDIDGETITYRGKNGTHVSRISTGDLI